MMEPTFYEAQADFGISLLKALSSSSTDLTTPISSVVLSPISVLSVLSLLNLGARNKTAEELSKIFGRGQVKEANKIAEYYGSYAKSLQTKQNAGNLFEAANKIYLRSGFSILPTFQESVKKYYGDKSFESVDFGQSETAAKTINDYVSNATHRKIENLIKPSILANPNVCIVLINAVYFLAEWASQFDVNSTVEKPFFTNEGNSIQLPQMHKNGLFGYFEDDQAQVLRMDYTGGDAFMILILPTERFSLDKLLKSIDGKLIRNWIENAAEKERIDVQLPKFKIESTHENLAIALQGLGLATMFDRSAANFSGISNTQLWVDTAIQKAFIKVDEKGTEAAAATVVMLTRAAFVPPTRFIADQPFLYVVADKRGNLLFLGIFHGN